MAGDPRADRAPVAAPGRRAWLMLGLGTAASAAQAVLIAGSVYLIPALQARGLSLAAAGAVASAPFIGVVLTLIAWGALADAIGERVVLAAGLLLAAAAGVVAVVGAGSTAILFGALLTAGLGAAAAGSASGRVVIGWFPPQRRGLVMGLRQMSTPLGTGIGALTVPAVAARAGIGPALVVPVALVGLTGLACARWVVDPPRPARAGRAANPYRGGATLLRIHLVSVLLVVPQFVVSTFALVWLTSRAGWSAGAAGVLLTVAQFLGAAGRAGVGVWSDRVRSRMRPLRWVAVAAAVVMAALALAGDRGWHAATALLVLATVVTVADNGLAFTAVAEIGGPFWAGRALGAQNTAQFLAGAAAAPAAGALIAGAGFPATFLLTAALAAGAVPLVPVGLDRRGALDTTSGSEGFGPAASRG